MPKSERRCARCQRSFFTYLVNQRYCSHHCESLSRPRDDIGRFWSHVDRRGLDECWEWQASRDKKGYGQTYYNKRGEVAHRVSYLIHFGEFDRSLLVCHTCDNPPCVNPRHLFLGTAADNTHDSWRKGRGRINPKRGSEHPNASLTEDDVRAIREARAGGAKLRELETRFQLSHSQIQDIVRQRAWKHVKD